MKAILLVLTLLLGFNPSARSQWIQKADFIGSPNRSMAVGFSIGDKGYLGTGAETYICGGPVRCDRDYKDFWEYNPVNNTWTRKADFGGEPRIQAVGFSIGDKGYIGTGGRKDFAKDFWEYNPTNDAWTRKADFPGWGRWAAVGFSIGNKGYIGLGLNGTTNFRDFWEYDPSTDTWTKKADFPGADRSGVVYFSIGNKGYVGVGLSIDILHDFWEYDPASDTWKQIADFPGSSRQVATGFSIGNKGYVVAGHWDTYLKDVWEWDSSTNKWSQKEDFAGSGRIFAVGFSIGSTGYFGTGSDGIYKNDFWQYMPDVTSHSLLADVEVKLYPNPTKGKITIDRPDNSRIEITTLNGQLITSFEQHNSNRTIDIGSYPNGIYVVKVRTNEKIFVQKIIKTGV